MKNLELIWNHVRSLNARVPTRSTITAHWISVFVCAWVLAGCSNITQRDIKSSLPVYPLNTCDGTQGVACVNPLFLNPKNSEAIQARDSSQFPNRYLELWDTSVRTQECNRWFLNSPKKHADCVAQLTRLSLNFNPEDKRPDEDSIGLALEGGGSKAAPYSLGAIAGLQQNGSLGRNLGAVSSVSGGGYAAYFLFSRYMDQTTRRTAAGTSDPNDWFRSCIPDLYSLKPGGALEDLKKAQGDRLPNCGEGTSESEFRLFKPEFAHQGHVWTHPDVLRLRNRADLRVKDFCIPQYQELANATVLLGATAVYEVPNFLMRSLTRQPVNSSPTREAYKNGIEREYGYSVPEWQELERTSTRLHTALRSHDLHSMGDLARAEAQTPGMPTWIIAASTPGAIDSTDWVHPVSRDPLRHQFELTSRSHGSGLYGYANIPPEGALNSFSTPTAQMPVVDAVVTAAAFFDDSQSLVETQPWRFFVDAGQHFLNISWFSEIRNFNATDADRDAQKNQIWPFYSRYTARVPDSPYIHLQDGGNSDTTGIFPLLRRGYRKIIYVHGTEDQKASLSGLCHLKNQLELDRQYFIVSPDFETLVNRIYKGQVPKRFTFSSGEQSREFASYLDYLCTQELGISDLWTFENNKYRKPDDPDKNATQRLICARLAVLDPSQPATSGCREFQEKFPTFQTPNFAQWPKLQDLFFQMSDTPIKFLVYRGDIHSPLTSSRPPGAAPPELLSVIFAIFPTVSYDDLRRGIEVRNSQEPGRDEWKAMPAAPSNHEGWEQFCKKKDDQRWQFRVSACMSPENTLLALATAPSANATLPCNALAYLIDIEGQCKAVYPDVPPSSTPFRHSEFPQNHFVAQTFHSSYTKFAAYFDLARNQILRSTSQINLPWSALQHPARADASTARQDTLANGSDPSQPCERTPEDPGQTHSATEAGSSVASMQCMQTGLLGIRP